MLVDYTQSLLEIIGASHRQLDILGSLRLFLIVLQILITKDGSVGTLVHQERFIDVGIHEKGVVLVFFLIDGRLGHLNINFLPILQRPEVVSVLAVTYQEHLLHVDLGLILVDLVLLDDLWESVSSLLVLCVDFATLRLGVRVKAIVSTGNIMLNFLI